MGWQAYLLLDDAIFDRDCQITHTKGSGPGGQKRNKTSSAVRITHLPTGLDVRAEESRSQKSNRKHAIHRLKLAIAMHCREPATPANLSKLRPSEPSHLAIVLDALEARNYSLSDAAPTLNASTGQLSRFLCAQGIVLEHVNRSRADRGMKPIRT
jgi:hypothetical protein